MTSANQNQINRLMKEISDIQKSDAQEAKKGSDLLTRINRANEAASRTKSVSTVRSKLREVERFSKALANVQKKRAGISKKLYEKSKSLNSYREKQSRDDERDRRRYADQQKKLIRERDLHERRITGEIQSRAGIQSISPEISQSAARSEGNYDFFISHASEDKDSFVRGLAEALQAKKTKVWYDEFTLVVGDSLRRKIDQGLRNSRYGIVVLSKNFFAKEWPQRELDGLVSLEVGGLVRILPIWHEISIDEVARYSPTLADKIALNTSLSTTENIADELAKLVTESRRATDGVS